MSIFKKLASQTAVYGLSQIVGRFVNYLLVPLYTNILPPSDYGVVTMLYAYVTFFNVLLTYGMETAFFRFSNTHTNPRQVYTTGLISVISTSFLFVAISGFITPWVATLIRIPDHPEYVWYFVLILSLDAISAIPFALLRQQNRPFKFAIIRNINIFCNILLNLYFLVWCPYANTHNKGFVFFYDAHIGMGYIFISNLVASAITIPLLIKEFVQILQASFSKKLWVDMLVYALPLMIVGMAGMVNETIDRILITWLYDDVETGRAVNGIYGANYKLSILMSLFIQAFRYAAEPFFFAQAKDGNKKDVYAHVMDYFVWVCLGLFLLVTLFLDVFKHFIGEQYREGLTVVPILLLANMFLGVYYNLSIWYKLSNQTQKGAWISLMGAGITLALNFWWIPVWGYMGAAWATFICYFCMMLVCYFLGKKYYPIPYHLRTFVISILLALGIYFFHQLISTLIQQQESAIWFVRVLLLALFGGFIWWFEKKNKRLLSSH